MGSCASGLEVEYWRHGESNEKIRAEAFFDDIRTHGCISGYQDPPRVLPLLWPFATRSRQNSSNGVANPRAAKLPASKAFFANCPFDDGYKPIFRAMIFAVVWSGYHPRCALDATDRAEIRVSKIAKTIGECDSGIHDLSRVEVDAGGVLRFNMSMELSLHLGARLFGSGRHRRKRALILEAQPHRYDDALSDISGQDIEVHANDPGPAIRCVRNWLSEHRAPNEPPFPVRSPCWATIASFRRMRARFSPPGVSIRSMTLLTVTSCSPSAIGLQRGPEPSPNQLLEHPAGLRAG